MPDERTSSPPPLVSINIPCYRQLPYLRSCLSSIFAQTLRNFEVNILDDGESDEYRQYVATLGDPRVRYHRNSERLGAMLNIFQAIFAGDGRYTLAFHEDDVLEPNYLEAAVRIFETHPECGFVAAEVRELRDGSPNTTVETATTCPAYDIFRSEANMVRAITCGIEPMFGSVVYRRSALAGVHPDHERYGTLVDRPFLLGILRTWSAAVIREPVAWYRVHGGDDDRHEGMSSRQILELLKTYRAALPQEMRPSDAAPFHAYAANWLKILYRLTPDSKKPSFGRFMFQAWREGIYSPRWERRFGAGRVGRALYKRLTA